MISVIIIILALLCLFWDVAYYIRGFATIYIGRAFQRKYKITETTSYYGICTTKDVDFFFAHMNNARFIRILDFARIHFYDRTDLYQKLIKANGQLLVGASNIRYRRSLDLFNLYRIETKLMCWNDKTIFLEHKFITLKDEFVRAIAHSRSHIIGLDLPAAMADVPGAESLKKFPDEIVQWQDALETTSAKLRKKD
ncbi:hypothetical protein MSG28_007575 [Choristoneura fumiferana]|uniref:Uncharacterized protein n=1 Tax=Choristoneura fumiferana TaxID=7141 RepID=A0ACC0JXQ9_CHOFU|nr:hypothetical protein MSG28_007575 [Choristoneura fumiferana]